MVTVMKTALVFAIEEFSVYDGPGIRSTVFLKGCPLLCSWCHNPEGQAFHNEICKNTNGCRGCGACVRASENGALTENSVAACPTHALRWAASSYTPEELVSQLLKNRDLLTGGVTFSGGEPLSHPEFLQDCLQRLCGHLHRAIQTCGYADSDVFRAVLSHTDYVLYDLKLLEDAAHRHFTGVSNAVILENFRILCQSGVPFVVRTPLIPGVTDTEQNLAAIAALLKENGVGRIELLPYHTAAGGKYASLGRVFQPAFDESVAPNPRLELFKKNGIAAVVL